MHLCIPERFCFGRLLLVNGSLKYLVFLRFFRASEGEGGPTTGEAPPTPDQEQDQNLVAVLMVVVVVVVMVVVAAAAAAVMVGAAHSCVHRVHGHLQGASLAGKPGVGVHSIFR